MSFGMGKSKKMPGEVWTAVSCVSCWFCPPGACIVVKTPVLEMRFPVSAVCSTELTFCKLPRSHKISHYGHNRLPRELHRGNTPGKNMVLLQFPFKYLVRWLTTPLQTGLILTPTAVEEPFDPLALVLSLFLASQVRKDEER